MKIAAYGAMTLVVLISVALVAALVVGFSTGVVQIDGAELTIRWGGESDGYVHWDRGGMHDFYISGPIWGFAIVAALPPAVLTILATIMFGRSSSRRKS